MFDAFLPSHSSILARQNKPWSFVNIGRSTDPTRLSDPMVLTGIGPQRPELADDQGIPEAPTCEMADTEGGLVDPVTGKALAPLQHEGLPRRPTADPTVEV
jgi:hypothetical protein